MSKHSKIILLSSFLSLIVSIYTEYVKHKMHEDKDYIPVCDINEYKCSKVMTSEYSVGFGLTFLPECLQLSNSLYGIVFYIIMIAISLSDNIIVVEIQLFLASISSWLSIYLAYVLYYIIQDVCIFCVLIYVLNFITVIVTYKKYNCLKSKKTKRH
ncbi:vitamin K epoxide reductase complex subunit 1-like protein 1 [Chironomus tepperi]|uniref:vitamin K epoxide reductase complex subunit 1-like protein 1 n=1 Tax=Chironomus tepperi TaxID=113505 RepID=UPI00391F8279